MQIILNDPNQAHKALQKLWLDVKNKLMAGKRQLIELRNYDDCGIIHMSVGGDR